jgi:putative aldouronate transport system permease protein
MRSRTTPGFRVLNFIFMGAIVAATLYPMLYVFGVSFSSPNAVMRGEVGLLPVGFTTQSYELVINDRAFWTGYRNTILYTVVGTAIAMTTTILAAYPLSKKWLRGNSILMNLFLFTMFFNGGLIPNFLFIRSLGLMSTIWAIVLPLAINPFYMIIMRAFFQSLPESLEEAAEIDGLNPLRILTTIVLPLSKPILATVGLFYAVFFWNDWFRPLIFLNDSRMQPVTLYLRNMVMGQQLAAQQGQVSDAGSELVSETLKSASILLVSVPIICLYPFVQRYFVKGILIGSVKG